MNKFIIYYNRGSDIYSSMNLTIIYNCEYIFKKLTFLLRIRGKNTAIIILKYSLDIIFNNIYKYIFMTKFFQMEVSSIRSYSKIIYFIDYIY